LIDLTSFSHPFFEHAPFTQQGINLHGVLDINALPADVNSLLVQACDDLTAYRQLLVLGHGGSAFWRAVSASVVSDKMSAPIDTFTIAQVEKFFAEHAPDMSFQIVYPGPALVPLQRLGALLGWHNDTPFKVGVNQAWGSWFAYRALLLVDSELTPSMPLTYPSPCDACERKPCVRACPVKAVSETAEFDLDRCMHFRNRADSPCGQRCLSRLACPVGSEHRYSDAQLSYHYGCSMGVIERHLA